MTNRREFIQHAAAGVAGLAVSQYAFSNSLLQKKKEKLGVALVGLGYYSTDLLAPALQLTQHCYLAGVVTGTPAKAEKWKQTYRLPDKNIYNYQNFDSLANNPEIDVVYVVLPPSMHAEYAVRAAQAGKHVWCEKPMAMTEAECQRMIDACNKNKVKLSIGYRMHHEPNTHKVQERIDLWQGVKSECRSRLLRWSHRPLEAKEKAGGWGDARHGCIPIECGQVRCRAGTHCRIGPGLHDTTGDIQGG